MVSDLSASLSVCDDEVRSNIVDRDSINYIWYDYHIGWNTSRIISRLISLRALPSTSGTNVGLTQEL